MFLTRLIRTGPLRHAVILPVIALALMLGACGGQPATEAIAAGWAGKVEGTDAFIGIASNGHEVMAYVCDGQTISQWFHGDVGKDKLDLVAGTVVLSDGAAALQAQLTQDTASGSVTLADGRSFKFQASRAAGDAGLYRSEQTIDNENWLGGWVVLSDGQLRGALANLDTGRLQTQTSLNNFAKLLDSTTARY